MKPKLTSRCDFCSQGLHRGPAKRIALTNRSRKPAQRSAKLIGFQISTLALLLAAAARVIFCPVPLSGAQMAFLIWAISMAVILLGVTELKSRTKK
jgi:hypothetical protein